MKLLRVMQIRQFERGLLFRNGDFVGVLEPGRRWVFDLPLRRQRVDVVSTRDPELVSTHLDVIVKSGALEGAAKVVDLADDERGLVWVDGRFEAVLAGGLFAFWTATRDVRVEVVDAREVRLDRPDARQIWEADTGNLDLQVVPQGSVGLLFVDERLVDEVQPGVVATWRRPKAARLKTVDLRERTTDVAGQELMTADRVTLRLNAVATWKVTDARKAATVVADFEAALRLEAQLALRAVVGAHDLDSLLEAKDAVATALTGELRQRTSGIGVEVQAFGVRDVILPGDMKTLLNRVMEARTAAEAALLTRREETAAMRSQANTAKLLEKSPTLMRMRELEVLEKVAAGTNLQVVLGEKGLADRVVNLL